jgi:hypothetical protein
VGRPGTHAKLIVYQAAVKCAVETLRAKIAQQNYTIGKYKFLVNSQILNWTIQACFRKELPLGSLGSKKLATSESSFTKVSRLPTSEVCGSREADLRHTVTVTTFTLLNFIQAHLVKVTGKLE